MALTRKAFIVPDETPRPQGRRTMTVGRRSYSWDTSRDTSPIKGGRVTDSLPDDDDGSALMEAQVTHAGGYVRTGYVQQSRRVVSTNLEFDKYGNPFVSQPVPQPDRWVVERTTDMGDAPLPSISTRAELRPKKTRAPRVKSAPSSVTIDPGMTRDEIVRAYLDGKGLGHVVEITPAIRAAALDAIAADVQLADYLA